jgi:hypothetical protein
MFGKSFEPFALGLCEESNRHGISPSTAYVPPISRSLFNITVQSHEIVGARGPCFSRLMVEKTAQNNYSVELWNRKQS